MNFDQISFQIEHSAAIRLLRSRYASLALSFFQFAFKSSNRLQIPYSELKELLAGFLDHLEDDAKKEHSLLPQQFLDLWCNDQHSFLRKYFELSQDEPLTELTYDAERVLEWLQSLEKKEFVGTQSRFLSIYENMKQIADRTEENPASRLAFLKEQRKKLDDEIKEIQTTGILNRMDSTQIRERFLNLMDDSRRLLSEFRLVEDIFKELTRQIKEKKLKESLTKGGILQQVLDAYDHLEESDQGKSFTAFWNFLVSDENQSELKALSEKILQTPEIHQFVRQNPERQLDTSLRKLKAQLLQVGQKVLKSKFRLSEELRKLLHQRALAENKRVFDLASQIKKMLLENRSIFLDRALKDFISIQEGLFIQLPLSRPLWKPSTEARFATKHLESSTSANLNPEQKQMLQDLNDKVNAPSVSESDLEDRIDTLLMRSPQISLADIVKEFPIRFGTLEVLSYFFVAAKFTRHWINPDLLEQIPCPEQNFTITLPQIIFTRSQAASKHGKSVH